jgi:hypothetical protein
LKAISIALRSLRDLEQFSNKKNRFYYTMLHHTTPYTTLYQGTNTFLEKPGFTILCYTTLRHTLHYMYGTPKGSEINCFKKKKIAATPSSSQIWNFMQKFPFLARKRGNFLRLFVGRLQASELRTSERPSFY